MESSPLCDSHSPPKKKLGPKKPLKGKLSSWPWKPPIFLIFLGFLRRRHLSLSASNPQAWKTWAVTGVAWFMAIIDTCKRCRSTFYTFYRLELLWAFKHVLTSTRGSFQESGLIHLNIWRLQNHNLDWSLDSSELFVNINFIQPKIAKPNLHVLSFTQD